MTSKPALLWCWHSGIINVSNAFESVSKSKARSHWEKESWSAATSSAFAVFDAAFKDFGAPLMAEQVRAWTSATGATIWPKVRVFRRRREVVIFFRHSLAKIHFRNNRIMEVPPGVTSAELTAHEGELH